MAHARQTCDGSAAIAKIYSSVTNMLCFGQFSSPFSSTSEQLGVCSVFYASAGGILTSAAFSSGLFLQLDRGVSAWAEDYIPNTERERNRVRARMDASPRHGNAYRYAREQLDAMTQNPGRSIQYLSLHWSSSRYVEGPSNRRLAMARGLQGGARALAMPLMLTGIGGLMLGLGLEIAGATPAACAELIDQYVDRGPNCGFSPRIGSNTARFLDMDREDQLKAMRENPQLCDYYTQMASQMETNYQNMAVPQFEIQSCNSAGEPTQMQLRWRDGQVSDVTIGSNGDINFTSTHNRTENYTLDLTQHGTGSSKLFAMRVARQGFATRNISPSIAQQVQRQASGDVMLTDDQTDLGLGMRVHYAVEMARRQAGNRCRPTGTTRPRAGLIDSET